MVCRTIFGHISKILQGICFQSAMTVQMNSAVPDPALLAVSAAKINHTATAATACLLTSYIWGGNGMWHEPS